MNIEESICSFTIANANIEIAIHYIISAIAYFKTGKAYFIITCLNIESANGYITTANRNFKLRYIIIKSDNPYI